MAFDLLSLNTQNKMAAKKKQKQVNLIPQDDFESTTLGRILTWLLTTFRYIVIITEMIVMFAFLSRFWLDARNSDLTEEVKTKQGQILSSSIFEKEFKNVQKRLTIFSSLTNEERPKTRLLEAISQVIPPEVYLQTTSFSENQVTLSGYAITERDIAQFMVNLESGGNFEEVALTKVDTDLNELGLIGFSLTLSTSNQVNQEGG